MDGQRNELILVVLATLTGSSRLILVGLVTLTGSSRLILVGLATLTGSSRLRKKKSHLGQDISIYLVLWIEDLLKYAWL